MKNIVVVGVVFFTLLTVNKSVFSSELMTTADAFEAGSWQLSVYGQYVEEEPVVESDGSAAIQLPPPNSGVSVFATGSSEIEMESEYEAAIVAVTFRPNEGLHYRFKAGQVREFEIQYASGSLTNSFESQTDGLIWGFGGRWNATQGTIVSAAFAIDVSFTQTIVDLDRFQSGTTVSSAKQRYEQDEYQVALNISRRWGWFEPYGGLKVMHVVTRLKDRVSKSKTKGDRGRVSPFLGVSLNPFKGESFVLEVSFVDEESISAGVNLRFQ